MDQFHDAVHFFFGQFEFRQSLFRLGIRFSKLPADAFKWIRKAPSFCRVRYDFVLITKLGELNIDLVEETAVGQSAEFTEAFL